MGFVLSKTSGQEGFTTTKLLWPVAHLDGYDTRSGDKEGFETRENGRIMRAFLLAQ